jgi:hypothetical protein
MCVKIGKPMLEKASMWSIGNGRSIDAWKEIWIDDGMVMDQLTTIPNHLRGKKLFELVDERGNWDWNILHDWVPEHILKKIAAVTPRNDDYGADERVMAGCSTENFSVAGMYTVLSGFHGQEEITKWKRIWKLIMSLRE